MGDEPTSDDEGNPVEAEAPGDEFRQSAHTFSSHEEARAHEIAEQADTGYAERMRRFIELQHRVWGTDNPDVRESGAVRIFRRTDS